MSGPKALILEGTNGLSFFLHQTLLDDGLVKQVDLVTRSEQVTGSFHHPFQLIVINLLDTPEQGLKLSTWLNQQPHCCPVIVIAPAEDWGQLPSFLHSDPFILLPTSITLDHFSQCARQALTAYARL
jgi:DNA-binding NtrC family response regulator